MRLDLILERPTARTGIVLVSLLLAGCGTSEGARNQDVALRPAEPSRLPGPELELGALGASESFFAALANEDATTMCSMYDEEALDALLTRQDRLNLVDRPCEEVLVRLARGDRVEPLVTKTVAFEDDQAVVVESDSGWQKGTESSTGRQVWERRDDGTWRVAD